jgi:predicted transcriptional regulator with HTH domain
LKDKLKISDSYTSHLSRSVQSVPANVIARLTTSFSGHNRTVLGAMSRFCI